ncbi:hypothetical protein [Dulcicalothrix desertica]|nr:hypothetical protein [Dulcicalothrix desertica]
MRTIRSYLLIGAYLLVRIEIFYAREFIGTGAYSLPNYAQKS